MPPRRILLIPRHPPRRPHDPDPAPLRTAQERRLALDQLFLWTFPLLARPSASIISIIVINRNTPILRVPLRAL